MIVAISRWSLSAILFALAIVAASHAKAADPPCDKYPVAKQTTCAAIWKSLNQEDGSSIAQFGLDQLKRREEGKINAEQHLAENMAFIKQSTDKRLERLRARMEKE
jgi:hypothetical protein